MTPISRTDRNQSQVVDDLRARGYRVFVTSMVRNGFPDLVVAKWGRVFWCRSRCRVES